MSPSPALLQRSQRAHHGCEASASLGAEKESPLRTYSLLPAHTATTAEGRPVLCARHTHAQGAADATTGRTRHRWTTNSSAERIYRTSRAKKAMTRTQPRGVAAQPKADRHVVHCVSAARPTCVRARATLSKARAPLGPCVHSTPPATLPPTPFWQPHPKSDDVSRGGKGTRPGDALQNPFSVALLTHLNPRTYIQARPCTHRLDEE